MVEKMNLCYSETRVAFPHCSKEDSMTPLYDDDHDEKYAHLTPPERLEWPERIYRGPRCPIIVRRELTEEDYKQHSPTVRRMIDATIPWSQL